MKEIIYNKAPIQVLLLTLCLFKSSIAINFLEDSVTITPGTLTTIKVENDSAHEIKIDSIEIILLEGTLLNKIAFEFDGDPSGLYYKNSVLSDLIQKNDTTYFPLQYQNDVKNAVYGELRVAANSQRIIRIFHIGSNLGPPPTFGKKNKLANDIIGAAYTIKFIFYANDGSKDFITIKSNNIIFDNVGNIIRDGNTKKTYQENRNTINGYSDLLGRNLLTMQKYSIANNVYIIQQNRKFHSLIKLYK